MVIILTHIFCLSKNLKPKIHESHRAEGVSQSDQEDKLFKPHRKTTFAVVIGIFGFIAQFQGLRFSSWLCSTVQFIAFGLTVGTRVWVRRDIIKTSINVSVNNDYILDILTLAIVGKEPSGFKFPNREAFRSSRLSLAFSVITIPALRALTESEFDNQFQPGSGHLNQRESESASSVSQPSIKMQHSIQTEEKPNLAQQALNLRVQLGHIMEWTGSKRQKAIMLSNSIKTALERLDFQEDFGKERVILLRVDTYQFMPSSRKKSQEEVDLYIRRDGDKWKVDDAQLEALLSLVSYCFWAAEQNKKIREETNGRNCPAGSERSGHRTKEQSIENRLSVGWLRAKAPDSKIYHHVIGKIKFESAV